MMAPACTKQPSRCENAFISAPASTLAPGPNTTYGPTETSSPSTVSAEKKTVSGASIVTPASMASARRLAFPMGRFERRPFHAFFLRDSDDIGEVIFALGIIRPHRVQPAAHIRGLRHQPPGIAQRDFLFLRRGIGKFDNSGNIR